MLSFKRGTTPHPAPFIFFKATARSVPLGAVQGALASKPQP